MRFPSAAVRTVPGPSVAHNTANKADVARTSLVILAAVTLFFLVNNGIWLANDNTPPSYDKAAHTISAFRYLKLIEAPTRLSLTKLLTVTQYWPPLFHICSVPFTIILGFSVQTVAATNFLFLLIAVYSIFMIGRILFDDAAGAGAVVITMLCPLVFALSREVLIDFALMAMVTLGLHLMLVGRGGLDRARSWQLGLALGCAMLAKWTAVAFLVGPAIVCFAMHVGDRRQSAKSKLLSLAILLVTFAVVAAPWYVKAYAQFTAGARVALGSDPAREGDPSRFWPSVQWYAYALRDAVISTRLTPIIGLAVAIFGISAVRRKTWRALVFLTAWVVPAMTIFLLIPNKDARFIVPLVPALALMAAVGFQQIPWRAVRVVAWTLLIVVGTYQFYTKSFGWPRVEEQYCTHPPSPADWRYERILLSLDPTQSSRPLRIAILPNDPYFEPNLFLLAEEVRGLHHQIDAFGDAPEPVAALSNYDVFISKTGSIAIPHTAKWRLAFREAFAAWLAGSNRNPRFTLWRSWALPDGSQADVYFINRPGA